MGACAGKRCSLCRKIEDFAQEENESVVRSSAGHGHFEESLYATVRHTSKRKEATIFTNNLLVHSFIMRISTAL